MMAGMSALAAPMSCAGVVLSQPHSSTTPSSGLARMDSSTSMAIRLRNSMVVGRMNISPSEMVGNSSGKAAGRPHAALDGFGDRAQVRVAVVQFAPGIADADDRLVLEYVGGEAFRAQPGAAREAIVAGVAEPFLAAQFSSP